MLNQERIAIGIVIIAAIYLILQFFKKHLAEPLSQWFLKQGKVRWAMRCRKWALVKSNSKSGCNQCSCH